MPGIKKTSTQHHFCPESPNKYWIDYRKDDADTWKQAKPVDQKDTKYRKIKLSYDAVEKEIIINVNDPTVHGKYNVIFSPNEFVDWVRYPLIVCYVDQPRKMFEPDDYNLKYRPNDTHRRYDIPAWPVLGGSNNHPCGSCEVRLTFDDERHAGGWMYYSSRKAYMFIDSNHETAPGLLDGKEQRIPFEYEAIYTYKDQQTMIHKETEEVVFTYSRAQWKKALWKHKQRKEKEQAGIVATKEDATTRLDKLSEFKPNMVVTQETYDNKVIDEQLPEGSGEKIVDDPKFNPFNDGLSESEDNGSD